MEDNMEEACTLARKESKKKESGQMERESNGNLNEGWLIELVSCHFFVGSRKAKMVMPIERKPTKLKNEQTNERTTQRTRTRTRIRTRRKEEEEEVTHFHEGSTNELICRYLESYIVAGCHTLK